MQKLPQVLKNIQVKEKIPLEQMPELTKLLRSMDQMLGSEGRVLFRYSGTESKARIMIEGNNVDQINQMANDVAEKALTSIDHYLEKSV